ncbi:RNA-binding domain-containing protein [Falsarthrobacter nasiphocae]|uniref:ATP-dependent DNA helicase RecG n=1 Tax=Falsarthrobacter nasiphocae TaxID=189863 RepID=A0AAE3YER4_9MICC|nr:RNA-binding domain-containing protein [Falsarthrobacter nasiphocae]MDR6892049.1 ATP-dependent DNA helicase RecG [Falsarthrobacter nasiphocae]
MTWTVDRLTEALAALRIHRGDSTHLELKRAAGGLPQSCAETICAFANMPRGGTIVLGVDEARGLEVTGVEDPARLAQGLAAQARTAVNPSPHVEIETLVVDGRPVVIADVVPLPLTERPAETRGRAYLRQADGDYPMQPHELRMIEVQKLHADEAVHYDRTPVNGQTADDLDPGILADYLSEVRRSNPRLRDEDDAAILRQTGVTTASGSLTLAGLYAMGRYPQGEEPSLTVTAAVQLPYSASGGRTRNLQDFTGPIPALLEEIMDWVAQNVPTVQAYRESGHMRSVPEYPLDAVRELVANALVHRDLGPDTLGAGKSIQIRLTPRGLFIVSPGGLKNVSVEQLRSEEHAQAAVNQRLYAIAKKLRTRDGDAVVEGEGGGLRLVHRASARAGLLPPALDDTGVQFKVTLWAPVRDGETAPRAGTSSGTGSVSGVPEQVPALPDMSQADDDGAAAPTPAAASAHAAAATTKNGPVILAALAQAGRPLRFSELRAAASLSPGQVRYAVGALLDAGVLRMNGGQGERTTTYELTAAPAGAPERPTPLLDPVGRRISTKNPA